MRESGCRAKAKWTRSGLSYSQNLLTLSLFISLVSLAAVAVVVTAGGLPASFYPTALHSLYKDVFVPFPIAVSRNMCSERWEQCWVSLMGNVPCERWGSTLFHIKSSLCLLHIWRQLFRAWHCFIKFLCLWLFLNDCYSVNVYIKYAWFFFWVCTCLCVRVCVCFQGVNVMESVFYSYLTIFCFFFAYKLPSIILSLLKSISLR